MEFTDLLDEYLELKQLYNNDQITQFELAKLGEVTDEIKLVKARLKLAMLEGE